MSEEEIVKINRKLEKMIEKNEVDESLVGDFLGRLQEVRITLSILQRTGIGKTVNNLRRVTNNEQLTTSAKSLLKNWKKLVPENSTTKDETKSAAAAAAAAATTTTTTSNSSTGSQSSQETNSIEEKSSASKKFVETKSKSFTPVSYSLDDVRVKCRELLAGALSAAELPGGSADPVHLAARIEDAIFKEFKETNEKYRNRIRSRVSNLKDQKNPELRINVLLGGITPERLAVLTSEEMASKELKQQRSQLNSKAINEYQLAVDEGTGTDLVQCKRCKQNNCAYTEVQTRSADEPMTLFFFCKSCGNRWKM